MPETMTNKRIPGFTMADIKDPKLKIVKLNERWDHINEQIEELKDKQKIISHEISILKEQYQMKENKIDTGAEKS